VIDEMQLQNSIEFDDSVTGRKIKVEKPLASNSIEIAVKPLPSVQTSGYTGAVGQFAITAHLPDTKIESNTQGKLIVTIDGKGNFIQFGPPAIQWPKGFDVFDPAVVDELDKNMAPTQGRRKYVFSFTTNRTGVFSITPVAFSFFDPDLRKYRQINSDSLKLEILPAALIKSPREEKHNSQPGANGWIIFFAVLVILAIAITIFLRWRKKETIADVITRPKNYLQELNEITSRKLSAKSFCFEIQKLSKTVIKEYNLNPGQKEELEAIQKECELLIYSDIRPEEKRDELQRRVERLLRQLES
jgi:hypothetical protein